MNNDIVVVNGHFEILHSGHIDLFQEASQYGKLYVLVNSNNMAIDKKGFYFMDEQDRCRVIDAIQYVNIATIIEDEEQWERTMRGLQPAYYFCSGDRKSLLDVDLMIQEICDDIGCKIVFGNKKKVNSSSSLLKRYTKILNDIKS